MSPLEFAKSIQGTALLRLNFHPGTNMSEALAQTISYVNRAHAFMPPGTVSPFVIRFDAGTLPGERPHRYVQRAGSISGSAQRSANQ